MADKTDTKRKALNLETRYNIVQDRLNHMKVEDIKTKYNLKNVSHVSTIWKDREKIIENFNGVGKSNGKKIRKGKFPEVDTQLKEFVERNVVDKGATLPKDVIQEQGRRIASKLKIKGFKASNGYFERWKTRSNVERITIHGDANSVPQETVDEWMKKVPTLIRDYNQKDVYNVDEFALFYKLRPSKTYSLKGKKCKAGKLSKSRVTFLIGANMDGSDKLKLSLIGHANQPRGFVKDSRKFNYFHNKKAWMTNDIFRVILGKLNTRMKNKGRKILLFADNFSGHKNLPNYSNIEVKFFPANTTSVTQPMDMGIIKVFKNYYRSEIVWKIIDELEKDDSKIADDVNITLQDCINFSMKALSKITTETIQNCFKKAGFGERGDNIEVVAEDSNLEDGLNILGQRTDLNGVTIEDFISVDDDVCIGSSKTTLDLAMEAETESDDQQYESSSEDEIEEIVEKPNFKQICDAFEILTKTFNLSENSELDRKLSELKSVYTKDRLANMKTPAISNYFSIIPK